MTGAKRRADRIQAEYWNGALTRKEFQSVADEQATIIRSLFERIATADLALAFIAERIGITKEEFQSFVEGKVKELQARDNVAVKDKAPTLILDDDV